MRADHGSIAAPDGRYTKPSIPVTSVIVINFKSVLLPLLTWAHLGLHQVQELLDPDIKNHQYPLLKKPNSIMVPPTRALSRLLRPASRYRPSLTCTTTKSLLLSKKQFSSTQPTTTVFPRPQLKCLSVSCTTTTKRFYSDTPSQQDPEPPDYLSETELHIFHKLLRELGPSKLEVNNLLHPSFTYASRG